MNASDAIELLRHALEECRSYVNVNTGDVYLYPPYANEPLPDLVEKALKDTEVIDE